MPNLGVAERLVICLKQKLKRVKLIKGAKKMTQLVRELAALPERNIREKDKGNSEITQGFQSEKQPQSELIQ